MKTPTARAWYCWIVGLGLLMAPVWAWTTELIVNGSFETNPGVGASSFTGWTQVQQANSHGAFYVHSGSLTPVAHFSVPTPPLGSFAAVTDQTGPGSRVIYQDVAIPVGSMTTLSLYLMARGQSQSAIRQSADQQAGQRPQPAPRQGV